MIDTPAHTQPVTGDGAVFLRTSPHRTRLVVTGEADTALSNQLTRAAEEALEIGLPVDIDTRDVTFMDSSAVAALGWLAYQLPDPPRVIQPPDIVRFLLELTKLDEVVEIRESDPGLSTS